MVEDNVARLATDGDSLSGVSLSCDTGTFALLMWDRMSLESAKAAGRLTAQGD